MAAEEKNHGDRGEAGEDGDDDALRSRLGAGRKLHLLSAPAPRLRLADGRRAPAEQLRGSPSAPEQSPKALPALPQACPASQRAPSMPPAAVWPARGPTS
ncbi:hypothetical protein OsJ_24774 [Oryza sativa Japonica Group]|uniref:Uncharacterized protein n=1 Tax=Oryza sativa subsp. japonica TaxID=39947 RepID=B9FXZ2_ORYSJ|nr:hypothetical protein OsJ_24774 [Oryza sativa Japonica Group]